jgi:hypothetical protein
MTAQITAAYTSGATYPLNYPRIAWDSYTFGLTNSDISVSSTATGFVADGPLRVNTYEKWRPTAAGTWRIDLGSARDVDCVALLGDFNGVGITIEYSSDDSAWTTFATAGTGDNDPIVFLDSTKTARYWRVSFDAAASLTVIYICEVLEMQRPFFDGYNPSRQTAIRSSKTRGGQFIEQDIVSKGYRANWAFDNLTPSWYRANFEPAAKQLRTRPAFWFWNLEDYPEDTLYGWVNEDISPRQQAKTPGGRYATQFVVFGVGPSD